MREILRTDGPSPGRFAATLSPLVRGEDGAMNSAPLSPQGRGWRAAPGEGRLVEEIT
jgi:hypothetical protein